MGHRYVMNLTSTTEWLFHGSIKISLWMLYRIKGRCIIINTIYVLVKALLQGNISQGWSQEAHTTLVQYKQWVYMVFTVVWIGGYHKH